MKYKSILFMLIASISIFSMGCQSKPVEQVTEEQPIAEEQQTSEDLAPSQDAPPEPMDGTMPDNGQNPPMDGERPERPTDRDGEHPMDHHELSEEDEQQLLERVQGLDYDDLTDGTYVGEAEGFGPGLKVEVVVANGKITSVEITEHNEHEERFYGPAMEQIPQAIVDSQSTSVDIVSGATYTSVGILEAVEEALKEAASNS